MVETFRLPETVGQALGGRTPTLLVVCFGLALSPERILALADECGEDP
jgi:hypothetical protein